jgi:precorrin-2/cobalt-factor-2 C20-methyltransferase
MSGVLYGVGLGPGDPELVTLKAARIVRSAPVVAWFAKKGGRGTARTIADGLIDAASEQAPLYYPMTTEAHFGDKVYTSALSGFYEKSAAMLAARLDSGADVALLCEGDPMFYGSFMHLYERLRGRYRVEVCAGVSGMSGCFAAAGQCMTWGDDVMTVLPGTLGEDELAERLARTHAAVVMKLGSNTPKVVRALRTAGLFERAIYVERGTMPGQRIMPLAELREDERAPYFAMILVPGNGRRP